MRIINENNQSITIYVKADKTMKLSNNSEGYINLSAILSEKIKESIKELLFKETKKYYTRKEVCQLLSVSLPTLYQYIYSGKITALKISGRSLLDVYSINQSTERKEMLRYGITLGII